MGSNQEKSCCEKLFVAIRNPSPLIRTIRFTSPTTLRDRYVRVSNVDSVTTIETPPNVSLKTTKLNDRCPRIPKQSVDGITIENLKDHCPRIPKQTVTAVAADSKKQAEKVALFQDHKQNHPHFSTPNQAKPKATVLPVHGHENKIPVLPHSGAKSYIAESINGMSSEYIARAGEMIRSPSNVGGRKPSSTPDSFNDRVSDFINRTKNKFHSPSFNEVSEGKGKRLK